MVRMTERTKQSERQAVQPLARTRQLKILHLIVTLGHANAQFNEHCLPVRHERDITICSFHPRTVDVPPEIDLFEGDGTVRGFVRALRRALASGPYDIVHAHAPGTATALVLTSVLSRRSLWNGVLTVHNSRESFPLRNQALLVPLFAAFPTVVFCSQAAFASFPAPFRSLARTVEVVPNGVDTARVSRAVGGNDVRPTDRFRVVAVGRLIPRKDPVTLLAAFRAMCGPEDALRFVGDGVQRPDVLDRAAQGGVGNQVVVTGAVEREEVYRQVAGSSVFVTPSRAEGLPVAVLEAMACGLPVVLSDIPSHREIAASVDFVPLVPPGDVRGFAEAIERVKAMSADERSAIGGGCRALVERRFSLETMQRSYERVYRAVAARRRGRRHVLPTKGEVSP
jgi:glycosyltransferase involved in cell wall biosynthesis